jgi:CheY-like chemotaxis protein
MYGEYLTWRGVEVREVGSAAAAFRELWRRRPDAVVTEDRLPDCTGPELVRALRRSRDTFDLPIVLLCSDTFAIQSDEADRYGCDRILVVPLLPEALLDVLRVLVHDRETEGPRPFQSWLFTRNDESVWIVKTTEVDLAVTGPKAERTVFTFRDARELQSFQAEYERRLTLDGYTLQAAGSDRRSGRDRRQLPRPHIAERRTVGG